MNWDKIRSRVLTSAERHELLYLTRDVSLSEDGYHEDYFTEETVLKSRMRKAKQRNDDDE